MATPQSSTLTKKRYEEIVELLGSIEPDKERLENAKKKFEEIMNYDPSKKLYTPEKKRQIMASWSRRAAELGVSVYEYKSGLYTKQAPCSSCGLKYVLAASGLCRYCDPAIKRKHLEKQQAVKEYLDSHDHGDYTTYDKTIPGCGRERPDFLWDLQSHFLVLEVDEHQHNSRPCECEQTRMINIANSLGGPPVFFIRFNPDDFKVNGEKQKVTPGKRHRTLAAWIKTVKEYAPEALETQGVVNVLQLYFDDYDSTGGFRVLVSRE